MGPADRGHRSCRRQVPRGHGCDSEHDCNLDHCAQPSAFQVCSVQNRIDRVERDHSSACVAKEGDNDDCRRQVPPASRRHTPDRGDDGDRPDDPDAADDGGLGRSACRVPTPRTCRLASEICDELAATARTTNCHREQQDRRCIPEPGPQVRAVGLLHAPTLEQTEAQRRATRQGIDEYHRPCRIQPTQHRRFNVSGQCRAARLRRKYGSTCRSSSVASATDSPTAVANRTGGGSVTSMFWSIRWIRTS